MTPCYFTSNCVTGIFPHPYTHCSLRPQPFADRHLRIIRSLPLSPYPFKPSILELLLLCLDVLLQGKLPKTRRLSRLC